MELNINNQALLLDKFEKWWYQEGSGFQQKKDEDIEEFVKRIRQKDKKTKIFLIGNAPTALYTLLEKMNNNEKPKLVVGAPVGFVGAAESKEELSKYNVPYIRIKGRKGGSTVSVSILHGILYQIYQRESY